MATIINTFDMISSFFTNLHSCLIHKEEKDVLPRHNNTFYNYSNISKMEEVVVFEQPRHNLDIKRRTRSDPNLKFHVIESTKKNKDSEWDIL